MLSSVFKWLVQKQQRELQQQMNTPASGMIDWNTLATHMQSRHTLQRQQFEEKKAELRKRSDRELKAQDAILEAHHKKRQVEAEACIKDFTDKICHTHQKMKAMLMTMHKERFNARRDEILARHALVLDGDALAPPSPPRTAHLKDTEQNANQRSGKESLNEGPITQDAVVRQKRRKNLMNNSAIQLAIEIHNEGVVVMARPISQDETEKRIPDKNVFISWGPKARSFLYSIVVGEIPSGYLCDQISCAGRGVLGGGLVKAMITGRWRHLLFLNQYFAHEEWV